MPAIACAETAVFLDQPANGFDVSQGTDLHRIRERAISNDRPPVANPALRSSKPATVSISALALYLDCSRTYIGKLEAEGVIQRQGDGFALDRSRVANLRYLRRERPPVVAHDAAHAKAKTDLLQIRIMEKHRILVRRDAVDELMTRSLASPDAPV